MADVIVNSSGNKADDCPVVCLEVHKEANQLSTNATPQPNVNKRN